MLTLFAGLVLNFSKIFWDWVLEARAAIIADVRRLVGCDLEAWRSGRCVLLSMLWWWNLLFREPARLRIWPWSKMPLLPIETSRF